MISKNNEYQKKHQQSIMKILGEVENWYWNIYMNSQFSNICTSETIPKNNCCAGKEMITLTMALNDGKEQITLTMALNAFFFFEKLS